ncbi:hypothetical protein HDU96_002797 [Phlyctochytrium bullatum]|nr:hypothetical protein HDU96_002797 [Phlyctochytrium bullatum]
MHVLALLLVAILPVALAAPADTTASFPLTGGRCVEVVCPTTKLPPTPSSPTPVRSAVACQRRCLTTQPKADYFGLLETKPGANTAVCYCVDSTKTEADEPSFFCPKCLATEDALDVTLCGAQRAGKLSLYLYPVKPQQL